MAFVKGDYVILSPYAGGQQGRHPGRVTDVRPDGLYVAFLDEHGNAERLHFQEADLEPLPIPPPAVKEAAAAEPEPAAEVAQPEPAAEALAEEPAEEPPETGKHGRKKR